MDKNQDNQKLVARLNVILKASNRTLVWHAGVWKLVQLDNARPLASVARYTRQISREGTDLPESIEPLVATVEEREAREAAEREEAERLAAEA